MGDFGELLQLLREGWHIHGFGPLRSVWLLRRAGSGDLYFPIPDAWRVPYGGVGNNG